MPPNLKPKLTAVGAHSRSYLYSSRLECQWPVARPAAPECQTGIRNLSSFTPAVSLNSLVTGSCSIHSFGSHHQLFHNFSFSASLSLIFSIFPLSIVVLAPCRVCSWPLSETLHLSPTISVLPLSIWPYSLKNAELGFCVRLLSLV